MPSLVVSAETESEWLALRRQCVTGSWVAAIMGRHPFRRCMNREAALTYYVAGRTWEDSPPQWWGRHSEGPNLEALREFTRDQLYEVLHGNHFYRRGALGATTDAFARIRSFSPETAAPFVATKAPTYWRRFVREPLRALQDSEPGSKILVELKQTGERYRKDWGTKPPHHYWIQAQAQMYVTGLTRCLLFCRIGADDCRAHLIEADELFHEEMVEACEVFWLEVMRARRESEVG